MGSDVVEVMNSAAVIRCHSERSGESHFITAHCENRDSPLRSEWQPGITSSTPLPKSISIPQSCWWLCWRI